MSRDFGKVTTAKKLWNKHVKPGSELQKEMSFFKALEGSFSSKHVAYAMLQEVKKCSKKLNKEKLEAEKTALIREVNSTFKSGGFFDKPIKKYTELASVQVLLNYCSSTVIREGVINPAMAEIEDKILTSMISPTENTSETPKCSLNEVLALTEDDVDGLVVNIMREKMNKKFAPKLTEDQKVILKQHVFGDDPSKLTETLTRLRNETIGLINEELSESNKKEPERTKLTEILGLLKEDYHDVSKTDDTTVTFYMTISKLNDELKEEGNK